MNLARYSKLAIGLSLMIGASAFATESRSSLVPEILNGGEGLKTSALPEIKNGDGIEDSYIPEIKNGDGIEDALV